MRTINASNKEQINLWKLKMCNNCNSLFVQDKAEFIQVCDFCIDKHGLRGNPND
jgi:formylmethanofuran dehydrogenase subunit E